MGASPTRGHFLLLKPKLCLFTSADDLEPSAVLAVNGLGLGLVAEMTVGVGIVKIADVLNSLTKSRKNDRINLQSWVDYSVLRGPVAPVSLARDTAKIAGTGEAGIALEGITVEG